MTDLEMTKLCAEAMGYYLMRPSASDHAWHTAEQDYYDPLHDDTQAMALVEKMHLYITPNVPALDGTGLTGWDVRHWDSNEPSVHADFNRAIVECVAEMQASLSTREESK